MTTAGDQRIRPAAKFFLQVTRSFSSKALRTVLSSRMPKGTILGRPSRSIVDLALMRKAGLNVVRIYHAPPPWFLDRCTNEGMRVLVTLPWEKHIEFLRERSVRRQITETVRASVSKYAGHPAILGYLVGNEISSTMARWLGARRVIEFVEELIRIGRAIDPDALFPMPLIRRPNICYRKIPIFAASMFIFTISAISKATCCDCKI